MSPKLGNHARTAFVVVVLCATGCATKINLNAGETDYRVATIADDGSVSIEQKYAAPAKAPERTIRSGESISIHLKQLNIANFSERLEKFLASTFATTARGEIAVIARVFEMQDGETIDFRSSALKKAGRLIYYTEDVRPGGHMLNESALPMYGPITYNGNPIVVELNILELDVGESQQAKALLSTLAALGAKAYAPASPILNALDSLGSELLSGEQDDIEMRYIFALYPEGGHPSSKYPIVAVGDYVLMRQEPNVTEIGIGNLQGIVQGFDPLPWRGLIYEPMSGRLLCDQVAATEPKCDRSDNEYRDKTYVVLQVNTGFPSIGLDVAQQFSEFQEEMEQEVNKTQLADSLGAVIDEFKANVDSDNRRRTLATLAADAARLVHEICTVGSNRERHRITEFIDVVAKKRRRPTVTDAAGNSMALEFTEAQWLEIERSARAHTDAPENVDQAALEAADDVAKVQNLITCNGPSDG